MFLIQAALKTWFVERLRLAFESTRVDIVADVAGLTLAIHHASKRDARSHPQWPGSLAGNILLTD